MSDKKELPADLRKFRDSYVEMFGTLPPLPAARFEFSGDVNPEFLRVSEQLRKGAFYSDVLDMKTTQLILFGMLLAEHNTVGAQAHAAAARKAGASWEELHTVMQLAAATGALWAANNGGALAQDAARQGAGDEAMIDFTTRRAGRGLFADRAAGAGRGLSRAERGRLDRQGLPLPHRRCDARGSPALHDGRRADRRAGAAPAWHRRSGCELPDARLCRRTVRRRPAARCQEIFHHPAGRDRRREIGQAVRRPARQVPALQLCRHGRGAAPAGDRGPRHQASAARHRQLDGRHADLDVGLGLSGLHGRAGADGSAADGDVEPQLDDAADDHRRGTQRSRLEQRQLHHAAARLPHRQCVLPHRHQRRHAWPIRRWRRRARRPTSC